MRETGEGVKAGSENQDAGRNLRESRDRLDRGEAISKTGNWELHLDTVIMVGSEGARVIYNLKGSQSGPLPKYRKFPFRSIAPFSIEPCAGSLKTMVRIMSNLKSSRSAPADSSIFTQSRNTTRTKKSSSELFRTSPTEKKLKSRSMKQRSFFFRFSTFARFRSS